MVEEEATKPHKFIADPVSVVVEEHKMLINEVFKTPDRSVAVAPAVQGEDDEVNFKNIITASKFSTIANEENFTNIADLTIPETGERSQELDVAAEKDKEETLHQDPPSIFQMHARVASFPKTWPSPPPQLDAVSINRLTGLRFCDCFIFIAPDLVCVSCSAKFVSINIVPSSANRFERVATSVAYEPTKMIRNTIFVFDPGGTFTILVFRVLFHFRFHILCCCTVRLCHSQIHFNLSSPGATGGDSCIYSSSYVRFRVWDPGLGFSHCKCVCRNTLLFWALKKKTLIK